MPDGIRRISIFLKRAILRCDNESEHTPYIVVTLQTGCVMISYQNLNLAYDFGALRYIEIIPIPS